MADSEQIKAQKALQKRNLALGLALGTFVIILGVVSYFRVGALM